MRKIRLGIIGCGTIADWHAKAILASKNGELAGVADALYKYAESFAQKYNAKAFSSVEEMIESDEIDAVCICTPSGFHAKYAQMAAEHGKHILVEKPLAVLNDDCKKLIETVEKMGVSAGVISQHRFSPAIVELKRLVDDGKLGRIITVDLLMKYYRSQEYYDSSSWRGTWALDGGSLMNQGIHGVDVMLYVMGPVKRVFGCTATLAHNMEAEDTAVATLEFESGALAVIQSSTAIHGGYPRRLTVSGTEGVVTVRGDSITKCDLTDVDYIPVSKSEINESTGFNDPKAISNEGHIYQIQDFIDAIIGKRQPMIPLSEGFKTVEVINAVYESSRTGQAVVLNQK